jgi:hypothetical protein
MTYFDVHNTKQSLISKIRRLIDCHHHTKVYTDEYLAYENLNKYGFVHKQVCHSLKEYRYSVNQVYSRILIGSQRVIVKACCISSWLVSFQFKDVTIQYLLQVIKLQK